MTQPSDGKLTEMLKRRTTGICLAVLLVIMWFFQGIPLRLGLALMLILSIWEMYAAFQHRDARPVKWVGLCYALLAMPAYLGFGTAALTPLMALFCMMGLGCIVLRGKVDFDSAVATLFPLIYPGLLVTLLFPLQDMQPRLLAMVAVGLSFLISLGNDLAAYEIGMRFGKRKLCPQLSPKKSVEGAVAGVAASMVIGTLVPPVTAAIVGGDMSLLPPLWHFTLVGLVGGVAAPVGDLTASMVKRYCGIKDYGSLFPGHGGMMDRIDSVVFTGAVVYSYFALVMNVFSG